MNQEIQQALESLNLSEKEIKVYLALLELGESAVHQITLKSELNRVTTYPILKSLIEKGFVSKFDMDKISHFKAIPPKQILDIIKEKELRIKSILPKLQEITKKPNYSTHIELFKGSKGLFSFIEKLYSGEEKEMKAYGNFNIAREIAKYQAQYGRNLRIEKNIKLSIIISPIYEDYMQDKKYIRITKIKVSEELKEINVYIIFSKTKVGIIEVAKDVTGVLIENPEIAKYHDFVFSLLEKTAKPFQNP